MADYTPLTAAELDDALGLSYMLDTGSVEDKVDDYLRRLVAEVRNWRAHGMMTRRAGPLPQPPFSDEGWEDGP